MVSGLQSSPVPPVPEPRTADAARAAPVEHSAYEHLARLTALRDEAAETIRLAGQLGRAPWVAGALGVGTLATTIATPSSTISAFFMVWLGFMAVAAIAVARVYGQALETPLDRVALEGVVRKFAAVLLFAGTAWGVGLSLAWSAAPTLAGATAFIAGISIALTCLLRNRGLALYFVAPATATGAFCAWIDGAHAIVTLGALVGGTAVGAAAGLVERKAVPALCAETGRPSAFREASSRDIVRA